MRTRLSLFFVSLAVVAMAGCTSSSPLIPYESPGAQPVVYNQPVPQQPRPKKVRVKKPVSPPSQPIVIEREAGRWNGGAAAVVAEAAVAVEAGAVDRARLAMQPLS